MDDAKKDTIQRTDLKGTFVLSWYVLNGSCLEFPLEASYYFIAIVLSIQTMYITLIGYANPLYLQL